MKPGRTSSGSLLSRLALIFLIAALLAPSSYAESAPQTQQSAAPAASTRHIGAIKAINGTTVMLAPDTGPDVTISVQPTTRLLRIAPGQKDLKSAVPIQFPELQVGDRILVAGKPSDDNASVLATTIVVMTRSDLAAQHQHELQDWQKRGVDGLVTAVDAAAKTVTISSRGKPVVIHCPPNTVIRRYAQDSVKFDDAKTSTLAAIHAGDQLRARGERSADGGELTAEEIVSGAFRNIAGTVNSVDSGASTVTVHDLLSQKNVTLRITPDSQLHALPPEMAQRIAMRLKRPTAGGAPSGASANPPSGNHPPPGQPAGPDETAAPRHFGGAPDLQQILSRTPVVALTDLHKGQAVVALSTEGAADVGTAITLLTGVEPILEAAPNAGSASILTPWSLGAPSTDAGGP
jgi:Domain of unknown function (DUF5666)